MKHIQVSKMDGNILYSVVNMKLRNEYADLNILCISLDIDRMALIQKLSDAGYHYHVDTNQFRAK